MTISVVPAATIRPNASGGETRSCRIIDARARETGSARGVSPFLLRQSGDFVFEAPHQTLERIRASGELLSLPDIELEQLGCGFFHHLRIGTVEPFLIEPFEIVDALFQPLGLARWLDEVEG